MMMKKKPAYLLGDGLKRGNQMLRAIERDRLNKLGTMDLFNPWDQKDINDKSKNPTAEMIFEKDTNAILKSEIIVADADNDSVGSTCEIGLIWGVNHILNKLWEIDKESTSDREFTLRVQALMAEIPVKQVYWQTNDVRHTQIEERGMRRSFSINQYLYGCLLDLAGPERTFDEIIEKLQK
jgi:nucleoside 2-deoxyribosyltransferase